MPKKPLAPPEYFDARYFKRWYGSAKTRAFTKADKEKRADFVLSFLTQLNVKVQSVCDLGCGLGHWQPALAQRIPKLKYVGVEYSPFLCEKYGWVQASAADYAPPRQFDLVIAQSVLHHLSDRDCAKTIKHIAAYCRKALYLEVTTAADWRTVVDKKHTDPAVHRRTGAWYRRQLAPHFICLGGGLWLARKANIPLFELETSDKTTA